MNFVFYLINSKLTHKFLQLQQSGIFKFQPGLVGGHCISVDPYYLKHKSEQNGVHTELISAARRINDSAKFYNTKTTESMCQKNINLSEANVLMAGCAFKENCSDIRNSKVLEIKPSEEFGIVCDICDPLVKSLRSNHKLKKVLRLKAIITILLSSGFT